MGSTTHTLRPKSYPHSGSASQNSTSLLYSSCLDFNSKKTPSIISQVALQLNKKPRCKSISTMWICYNYDWPNSASADSSGFSCSSSELLELLSTLITSWVSSIWPDLFSVYLNWSQNSNPPSYQLQPSANSKTPSLTSEGTTHKLKPSLKPYVPSLTTLTHLWSPLHQA